MSGWFSQFDLVFSEETVSLDVFSEEAVSLVVLFSSNSRALTFLIICQIKAVLGHIILAAVLKTRWQKQD